MPAWPHGDPSVAVRAILAQPPYRSSGATTAAAPKPALLDVLWQWVVAHVLRPLFAPLARALAASHGAGTALGIVLVVASLGALAFVVVRLVVVSQRAKTTARPDATASEGLAGDLSSHGWRALAQRAAQRGDYAAAIVALFSAALHTLDEHGIIAFDAARTAGEYRRAVRRERAAAGATFDELAERFVRAAYASAQPDGSDFAAAERALAALEPALQV